MKQTLNRQMREEKKGANDAGRRKQEKGGRRGEKETGEEREKGEEEREKT